MGKESVTVLKLRHEEHKVYLQILWSGILALAVSLITASFLEQTSIDPLKSLFTAGIIILSGMAITIVASMWRFDKIRKDIMKVEKNA